MGSNSILRHKIVPLIALSLMVGFTQWATTGCNSEQPWALDPSSFLDPPNEVRPIARWWWPGGSVSTEQLTDELHTLSDAGFGAVEIQPFTFGLDTIELATDTAIHTVGTPAFLERMRHALQEGTRLGLEVDVTLGSGWPGGGPFVGNDRSEQLLVSWYDMDGGVALHDAPPTAGAPTYVTQVQQIIDALELTASTPERLAVTAARFIGSIEGETSSGSAGFTDMTNITHLIENDVLNWDMPDGRWRVFSLARSKVGHLAVGAAYPLEDSPAWVFDHLSTEGVSSHLRGYGDPLLAATSDLLPHALFVDSFELIAQLPWTHDFASEFESTMGYDLTPYLPFVFLDGGETKYGNMFEPEPSMLIPTHIGTRIREDYEDIRAELFLSRCIAPLRDFAQAYGTALRLQAHGGYGHVLDAYALSDIPESEGLFAGGTTDFLKLASSAAHTTGRKVVTSESFVTVNLDDATLSERDFYLLSARAIAAGINRLVFHGFAYDYPTLDGRRWFPFAPQADRVSAGPLRITTELNEAHPMWEQLPEFTLYLARLGHAMSAGESDVSVAWFMPEHEIPDAISLTMGGVEGKAGESSLSKMIRRAGYDYDRMSPKQLLATHASESKLIGPESDYDILLIGGLEAAEPDWLSHIAELGQSGVPIIWVGEIPSRARGYHDAENRDQQVLQQVEALRDSAHFATLSTLGDALRQTTAAPLLVPLDSDSLRVSTATRKTSSGYVVALCNEYAFDLSERVSLELPHEQAQIVDPQSAETRLVDAENITINLGPGRCEILLTR